MFVTGYAFRFCAHANRSSPITPSSFVDDVFHQNVKTVLGGSGAYSSLRTITYEWLREFLTPGEGDPRPLATWRSRLDPQRS